MKAQNQKSLTMLSIRKKCGIGLGYALILLSGFVFSVSCRASDLSKVTVFEGVPHTIVIQDGASKSDAIVVIRNGKSDVAKLSVKLKEGFTDTVVAACEAKDLIGKAKTVTGCLATAGSVVCLYTGAAGGAGAGYCVVAITHTATGGAVDCVKGLASEVANFFGEARGYKFFENATVTPSDVIELAIDRACDEISKK